MRLQDPKYSNDPVFTRRRNAAARALDERESRDEPVGELSSSVGRVRFDETRAQSSTQNEDDDGDEEYHPYRHVHEEDETVPVTSSSDQKTDADEDAKRMHDAMKTIKAMFKDEYFASKPEHKRQKHRELYDEIAEPLRLTSKEKVQLFRHSLAGDALDFHRQSKGVKYKVWTKLVSVFEEKYSSRIRKQENSKKLANLSFKEQVKSKKGDHHAALDALVRRIEMISQMAKKRDQSEESKVDFLIQAVRATPWFLQTDARLLSIDESDMTKTVDEMHSAINAIKTHNHDALLMDSRDERDESKGILYAV